jgi:cysteine desulfurase
VKRVHLDHNATTPLRAEARALLLERLDALGGNPSALHRAGRIARQWLDEAREQVAGALGVDEDEVVFTSGGTESNNLALCGALGAAAAGRGLATSAAEHASVLGPAARLAATGRPVVRVGVDPQARPDLAALGAAARTGTVALVSVTAANNEVGTLTDLAALADALDVLGPARPLLHTDAVQALGRVPVDLAAWRADLASFSAHKVGGPLGVGVLVRRRGVELAPLLTGGGQEAGVRPGTENVPAVCAAALAIELAVREQTDYAERVAALGAVFWEQVQLVRPDASLLGPPLGTRERLPNTLNVSLPDVDGRVLVARLDLEGLEVAAGSACASGSLEPSHVLRAMGLDDERARAGLRVSLGRTTTLADVRAAVDILRRTFSSAR